MLVEIEAGGARLLTPRGQGCPLDNAGGAPPKRDRGAAGSAAEAAGRALGLGRLFPPSHPAARKLWPGAACGGSGDLTPPPRGAPGGVFPIPGAYSRPLPGAAGPAGGSGVNGEPQRGDGSASPLSTWRSTDSCLSSRFRRGLAEKTKEGERNVTTAGAGGCRGEASAPVPASPPPGAVVGSAEPRRILPPDRRGAPGAQHDFFVQAGFPSGDDGRRPLAGL